MLRNKGAAIVIVTAHAGSSCTDFSDPMDLSSCYTDGEIMRLADTIPRGLVDHIFAGHVHRGIAHVVNGISITSSYSSTRAFSRVDMRVDTNSGRIVFRKVHPPHWACLRVLPSTGECATAGSSNAEAISASYEGRAITPDPAVMDIAERAATFAAEAKNEKLGVTLIAPFLHPPATESPLANLMTDAVRQQVDGDVAIHNVVGGIRNILPAGELTFGAVYEMFPFDNRIATLELTGRELRQLIATQAHRARRRAGFSGMRVFISCADDAMDVVLQLDDGSTVQDDDHVTLIANDFLVLGGDDVLTPIIPEEGYRIDYSQPLLRDALVDWFRSQGGTLNPDDFVTTASPKWNLPESLPESCAL